MIKKITCGITGASGVLGNTLIKKLPFKFIKFSGNLINNNDLNKWITNNDFDLFLHLGAIVPTKDVIKNYNYAKKVNITAANNLLKLLMKKKNKPTWFFFSSTSHVYGERKYLVKVSENSNTKPSTLYGKTKLEAEKKIIKYNKNINICIGRIFSFTDKMQKEPFIIPVLKNKFFSKNKIIKINNLNHFRDFVSVDDIAKSIHELYKKKKTGIYNIGSGHPTNILNLANYLSNKYNKIFYYKKNKPTYLISNNNKLKKIGINIKQLSYKQIANAK